MLPGGSSPKDPARSAAASQESANNPEHVTQNIESVAALFAEVEGRVGRHQRVIERATGAVGRPAVTYLLALAVLGWITGNALVARAGLAPLDPPPFAWLQCAASVLALLMAVVILTTQTRLAKLTAQRDNLDLQVNLVAEQKIAKLISLVEELRRDLPSVRNRRDALAEAMTEAVDPHAVANELEEKGPAGGPLP